MAYTLFACYLALGVTLVLAIIRKSQFTVKDPTVIGGRRDIIPGLFGLVSGFAIIPFTPSNLQDAVFLSAIIGTVAGAFVAIISGKAT
ncbi:MAG: hypothetical protein WBF53_07105 [Litorimonas sp.]